MKRKKKPTRAAIKKKLDMMWSRITKKRWRYVYGDLNCAWCKVKPGDHSDHIANRWKHSTRWVLENCVVLCAGCHLFRKKREPAEWVNMVIETIGRDTYDMVIQESRRIEKPDYEKVLGYLQQLENSYGD